MVDAIEMPLPTKNSVSFAVDGWTSTNKLASTSDIACYMNPNLVFQDMPLAFDKVNIQLLSYFNSTVSITGLRSTYASTPSLTFER